MRNRTGSVFPGWLAFIVCGILQAETKRPDIVFILVDDMPWRGSKLLKKTGKG